ncbi:hypothetical protein [Serratia ureilytica]|uniref:hypothetical protein n=1 Tax=Serratia ureilytica TaxID=300181 RepID=UPI000627AF8E|nr:hypothetical protein [Serratia ureilytica]
MEAIARLMPGALHHQRPVNNQKSAYERASVFGLSLISYLTRRNGDVMGGYKAIIGGDAVAINPKYRASYMPHIRAVVQVIHNNLMQQFSDCNNGILRRQIIMPFPEVITLSAVGEGHRRAGHHRTYVTC